MPSRAPVFVLALLLGACRAEGAVPGSGQGSASAPRPERVTIEVPPVLRGLPIGPPDLHGDPTVTPCTTCHDGDAGRPLPADAGGLAGPHVGLRLVHGTLTCGACHHPTQRESLRLADGRELALSDARTLCSQCHGPQARDYAHGAHGGMRGYWDLERGPRVRNHCVSCHDPHAPAFGSFQPAPGPRDRFLPEPREDSHD